MERSENQTRPWQHPLYKLQKDMYHPFLFHNHLYFEMNDKKLQKLLMERDSFIRAIECKLVYFELTEKERDWLFYLRDCCLFEVHRRKFKNVLGDIEKLSRKNDPPIIRDLFQITQSSSHRKVWSWLIANDNVFDAGDYQRSIDEYPERRQGHNNELSHDELERPQESENNLDFLENAEDLEPILPNVQYLELSDDESDHPADQAECNQQQAEQPQAEQPLSEYILWPDYPREMLPNLLFEQPGTVADAEYLESQLSRRYEFQLVAEPRENKQKMEEPESQLRANQEESEQDSNQILEPDFVNTAIESALNYEGSSQLLSQSFAEQSSTSQDNRLIVTWDVITEAINKMNLDYEKHMRRAPDSLRFDTPPTASSTFSSSEENFSFDPTPTTLSDTLFTQSDSRYITPGTYEVPKASSNTHIKVGPITLKPVPEEEEGSEEEYSHNVAIPQPSQEEATSITPPTAPTYIDTDEENRSLASQPPPSRKRPASSMGEYFDSFTSGDLQPNYNFQFDLDSIESNPSDEQSALPIHNTPENTSEDIESDFYPDLNEFFYHSESPIPPNTPLGESTISESEIESQSEIDGSIPEAEPDFTNLPLPETPDEKENT